MAQAALNQKEFETLAYWAVGLGSEGSMAGADKAHKLSVASHSVTGKDNWGMMAPTENSGYTIGTLQTDMGQHPRVAAELVQRYQTWCTAQQRADMRLTPEQERKTIADLQRGGAALRGKPDIDAPVKSGLEFFLQSTEGRQYIHQRDVAQVGLLTDKVFKPLQQQSTFAQRPVEEQTKIYTTLAKAYNQNQEIAKDLLTAVKNNPTIGVSQLQSQITVQSMAEGNRSAMHGAEMFLAVRRLPEQNPLRQALDAVAANPLRDPTQWAGDATQPDLPHRYGAVKTLFMTSKLDGKGNGALELVGKISTGEPYKYGNNRDVGLFANHKGEFAVWNNDGEGSAFVNGQWRGFARALVERVPAADRGLDLVLIEQGQKQTLLHVAPTEAQKKTSPARHALLQNNAYLADLSEQVQAVSPVPLNEAQSCNVTARLYQRMCAEKIGPDDVGSMVFRQFNDKNLLCVVNKAEEKMAEADIDKWMNVPAEQTLAALQQQEQPQQAQARRMVM